MKNRSLRYNLDRRRLRHGRKCTKHKMDPCKMMQHLSNIWSSIHETVKQHWGWVEKKRCLYKKRMLLWGTCTSFFFFFFDLTKSLICICIKQPFPRYLLETLKNQLRKYKIENRSCLPDFAILEPKNFFRKLFVVVSDEKILC